METILCQGDESAYFLVFLFLLLYTAKEVKHYSVRIQNSIEIFLVKS